MRRANKQFETNQAAHRIAWKPENERRGTWWSVADAEPQRFSRFEANLVEDFHHAEFLEQTGDQVQAPADTPPETISTSLRRPSASAARKAAGSSRAIPSSTGRAPAARIAAASIGPFELRIWPAVGTWSGGTSSLPVDKTATVGDSVTDTSVRPTSASSPISTGRISRPGPQNNIAAAVRRSLPQDILPGAESLFLDAHAAQEAECRACNFCGVRETAYARASRRHRRRRESGRRS